LNAYQDFINICDSNDKLDFKPDKTPNIRNIGGRIYAICHAALSEDKKRLQKLLAPHVERSRQWYKVSFDYPWWEKIIWMYAFYTLCKRDVDIDVMWQEFKAVNDF
jgi:hypothetical protein